MVNRLLEVRQVVSKPMANVTLAEHPQPQSLLISEEPSWAKRIFERQNLADWVKEITGFHVHEQTDQQIAKNSLHEVRKMLQGGSSTGILGAQVILTRLL